MVRILEELEKLKATIELIVAGDDTSTTDPRANPHIVDKRENNVDLMIKRAEELGGAKPRSSAAGI